MVTRNDDPPTDRAAEEAEALYDKIFEEVCDLKPECLANALRAITDYVLKKMGESYKSFATSSGKGSGVSAMPQHCAALAKTYSAEAAHYKAMADTERKLAKAAK